MIYEAIMKLSCNSFNKLFMIFIIVYFAKNRGRQFRDNKTRLKHLCLPLSKHYSKQIKLDLTVSRGSISYCG